MANYNYKEWCEQLANLMWDDLNKQITKACEHVRHDNGDWTRFRDRVMGEFTDKYKIIEIAVSDFLSDRELTSLLTYEHPLDKVYHYWKAAINANSDNTISKFDLLGDSIDDLAEHRNRYIIETYDEIQKGNRILYFDRVMMCTGQMEYDPTGDVPEEDEEDLEQ